VGEAPSTCMNDLSARGSVGPHEGIRTRRRRKEQQEPQQEQREDGRAHGEEDAVELLWVAKEETGHTDKVCAGGSGSSYSESAERPSRREARGGIVRSATPALPPRAAKPPSRTSPSRPFGAGSCRH
jgi:hypothetical protein